MDNIWQQPDSASYLAALRKNSNLIETVQSHQSAIAEKLALLKDEQCCEQTILLLWQHLQPTHYQQWLKGVKQSPVQLLASVLVTLSSLCIPDWGRLFGTVKALESTLSATLLIGRCPVSKQGSYHGRSLPWMIRLSSQALSSFISLKSQKLQHANDRPELDLFLERECEDILVTAYSAFISKITAESMTPSLGIGLGTILSGLLDALNQREFLNAEKVEKLLSMLTKLIISNYPLKVFWHKMRKQMISSGLTALSPITAEYPFEYDYQSHKLPPQAYCYLLSFYLSSSSIAIFSYDYTTWLRLHSLTVLETDKTQLSSHFYSQWTELVSHQLPKSISIDKGCTLLQYPCEAIMFHLSRANPKLYHLVKDRLSEESNNPQRTINRLRQLQVMTATVALKSYIQTRLQEVKGRCDKTTKGQIAHLIQLFGCQSDQQCIDALSKEGLAHLGLIRKQQLTLK